MFRFLFCLCLNIFMCQGLDVQNLLILMMPFLNNLSVNWNMKEKTTRKIVRASSSVRSNFNKTNFLFFLRRAVILSYSLKVSAITNGKIVFEILWDILYLSKFHSKLTTNIVKIHPSSFTNFTFFNYLSIPAKTLEFIFKDIYPKVAITTPRMGCEWYLAGLFTTWESIFVSRQVCPYSRPRQPRRVSWRSYQSGRLALWYKWK